MEKEQHHNQPEAFAHYVIRGLEDNKRMGARLRRADNPGTEDHSWEYLARFGVNLEQDHERRAFATIGAAIARAKPKAEGALGIGRAIAQAYREGSRNEQAQARLRRLLACSSTEEVCDTLRPLLQLIASRGASLHYGRLLQDLLYFDTKTKERWAQDFFSFAGEPSAQQE